MNDFNLECEQLLYKAINMAYSYHESQRDKAGEPYILHLYRVAKKVPYNSCKTIAWLHDIIEDTEMELSTLSEHFPKEIIESVDALTKKKGEEYYSYISRVGYNWRARMVKLSDLEDNMDLTRIKKELTDKDINRTLKYHNAFLLLSNKKG